MLIIETYNNQKYKDTIKLYLYDIFYKTWLFKDNYNVLYICIYSNILK